MRAGRKATELPDERSQPGFGPILKLWEYLMDKQDIALIVTLFGIGLATLLAVVAIVLAALAL